MLSRTRFFSPLITSMSTRTANTQAFFRALSTNPLKKSIQHWAERILEEPNPRLDNRKQIAKELLNRVTTCTKDEEIITALNSSSKTNPHSLFPLKTVLSLKATAAEQPGILSASEILTLAEQPKKNRIKKIR